MKKPKKPARKIQPSLKTTTKRITRRTVEAAKRIIDRVLPVDYCDD